MNSDWSKVSLHEILFRSEERINLIPEEKYKEVTVRLWGKGVTLRREVNGAEIASESRFVVRPGQFIVSRIDARNGAFGLVPDSLDGALVTNDFPIFNLNVGRLFPPFLEWMSKTHGFVDLCKAASEGTTNRVRLKEERFLAAEIYLPPPAEQQRIVSRIEELAAKIEEARGLRRQSREETERFLAAEEFHLWPAEMLKGAPLLEDVTVYLSRGRQSEQGVSNHYLIKTQHVQMGNYIKSSLTLAPHIAAKVAPEAIAQEGDILIACSAAGCLGRVARFFDSKQVASTDTHVAIARANTKFIKSEYLYAYLKGAQGQLQLRSRERGDWTREKVGFRLTELNLADLKRVPVPLPSLPEQRLIVDYLERLQFKVESLNRLQTETAAELDALLPSILDKAFNCKL